jgi:hypothetical protein
MERFQYLTYIGTAILRKCPQSKQTKTSSLELGRQAESEVVYNVSSEHSKDEPWTLIHKLPQKICP